MIKCVNCGAKHYDGEFVCTNCNHNLPEKKARKTATVYCLKSDYKVTTKKLTEKFLNDNADSQGFIELLKDYNEEITYLRRYNGTWKVI